MTVRAFLAIQLDEAARRAIGRLQQALKTTLAIDEAAAVRLRWVQPDTFHLTLKFLGDIPEPQVPLIKRALADCCAGAAPTTLTFEQLGVFPSLRAPRVLWIGAPTAAGGSASLSALAAAIDQALVPLGFPAERKPFQPHLTLARIREGGPMLGQLLTRTGLLARPAASLVGGTDGVACPVARVHLMRSELQPAGPRYSPLWSLELSGRPGSNGSTGSTGSAGPPG